MISYSSILKYRDLYPNDFCAYGEPSDNVLISNNETGESFVSPSDETDEVFLDRINRCKESNKNLFYDEWEKFEYKEGIIY